MSILIGVIDDQVRGVYLAADNRSLDLDNKFVSDFNTKVFAIRPDILYGLSGLTEEGLKLLALLNKAPKDLPASELVKIASKFKSKPVMHNGRSIGSTFVLAGIYDNGQPFLFDRTVAPLEEIDPHEGPIPGHLQIVKPGLVVGQPAFIVSAPKEKTSEVIRQNFVKNLIEEKGNYSLTIARAIKYAASIDNAISPTMDIFTIDTLEKKMYNKHMVL